LQIVAKPGDDGALLQIAQQMELMLHQPPQQNR